MLSTLIALFLVKAPFRSLSRRGILSVSLSVMRASVILLVTAALLQAFFLSVIAQECPLDLTWANFSTISTACSNQSQHGMCCRYINALVTLSVSQYSSQTGTLSVPLYLSSLCISSITQTLISNNISSESTSFCGLGVKIPVNYNCQELSTIQDIIFSPNFNDVINNCGNKSALSSNGCRKCLNSNLSYLRHLIGAEEMSNNNVTMNICRDASFIAVANQLNGFTPAELASCFFTVQSLSLIEDDSSIFGPALAPAPSSFHEISPSENLNTFAFNEHRHNGYKLTMVRIIGIMVTIFSVLLILILLFLIRRKRRELNKMDTSNDTNNNNDDNNNREKNQGGINSIFRIYGYKEMKRATRNFSTKLGRGENGIIIFKGQLDDGSKVAIKCIKKVNNNNNNLRKQGENEFVGEMEFLVRLHHKHLVSIKGFCFMRNERFLVYEYMENGSLKDYLHSTEKPALTWQTRIRILIDVANALEYLHCYCDPALCHGDIKSSNVLLDSNFLAKVANFGLAHFSTDLKIHGTPGYIDPEYITTNQLTTTSDVYSFGILLLELVTGKPPPTITTNPIDSVHALNALVDPTIRNSCDSSELNALLEIIRMCAKKEGRERPCMKQVVRMLYDKWDPLVREFGKAVEIEEGQYCNFAGLQFQSSSSTSRSYCSRSVLLDGKSSPPDSPRGIFSV